MAHTHTLRAPMKKHELAYRLPIAGSGYIDQTSQPRQMIRLSAMFSSSGRRPTNLRY